MGSGERRGRQNGLRQNDMGTSEQLRARVNDDLVLEAGTCEEVTGPNGPECLLRPPAITLFHQVLAYLQAKSDPPQRVSGSMVGREGVAPRPESSSPARRTFGPARSTARTLLSPATIPGEAVQRHGPLRQLKHPPGIPVGDDRECPDIQGKQGAGSSQ